MSESIRRNSDVGCMLIHVANLFKQRQPHEMPAPERLVLLALSDAANKDDGYRWAPGNQAIRKFSGLSDREVKNCKEALRDHGFISIEQRKTVIAGRTLNLADMITVHPDFGTWWEETAHRRVDRSRNFKSKKSSATPSGTTCTTLGHGVQEGGSPHAPPWGTACTTLGHGVQTDLQDLQEHQDLQEREAADATALALLTAPSTQEVQIVEAAPKTSPSPMATQEIAQTVQAPIQTTFPGMEAPTAVKEAKTRRMANSGAAKTKLTADEKKAKRDAAIDAWTPSPDTVAEQKRLRISDDQIKAIRLKFKRSFKKAQIPEELDALCVELMLEIPEYRRNGGVANRNAVAQPMQTVASEDRQRNW